MADAILKVSGIHKRFPGVHALKGVDFEVQPGEIHALLGENGAGKSTLIKTIAGVHRPTEGTIFVDGQEMNFSNPREAQDAGIATMYQELSLYPELTVAENIFMGHAPKRKFGIFSGVDWQEMEARSRKLLEELEITTIDVKRLVGTFNVGNRQRVEIAKALSLNARLLIMDEPTAALTESDVESLFNTVRLLRDRGVGIIYISHKLVEVFELADRVTVLRDGAYIGTKNVSETNENELVSMMVGRTIENLFPKQESEIKDVVLEVKNLVREPYTKDVSFHVRAGEIVGLSGLVGSGRSETAQVIFGIDTAESGDILIDGKKVQINTPSQAIKHGIAYVPEDRGKQGLVREMTIRENISMSIMGQVSNATFIDFDGEKKVAKNAIEKFGIRAYGTEQIANNLSGGNQQKVVVGKWLASNPRLLIIDEPTRGVDVGAKAEIHRLISELAAQQGLAILMISSELPEILGMSDRILVMQSGKIVAEFTREEATQEKIGTAMMASKPVVNMAEEA